MALVNANFRESTLNQSWYDTAFRSTYSLKLMPQTFGEVMNRYGEGLSFHSFLNLAGRTMGVKSPTITIFEQGAPTRPVKVSISTDSAPINATAITVASDDHSDDYVREGFDIIIPASYTDADYDVPLRLSYNSGWKGTAYDETVSITTALTTVYVAVGASSFAPGTDQPDPMSSGAYSRTTEQRILKSTIGIEGGALYQQEWKEFELKEGGRGIWTQSIAELDYDLDDQLDSALLTGIKNTNTSQLVGTSVTGTSNAVPSFDGLVQVLKDMGQELTWDATGFNWDKFRAVKALLENVGVVNKKVDFFVGSDLNASIESSALVDLNDAGSLSSYWSKIGEVGFSVKKVTLNGVEFNIAELTSLSNPNKFGLSSYNFKKMGFMFTQGEYKAELLDGGGKVGMRLPHLTLGFPNYNGENRQRIFIMSPGVHGVQGLPNVAVNGYDGYKMYGLMHVVPIWNHMYQAIHVKYDGDAGGGS